MSQDITEETLEEGRVALYQLERELKDRGVLNTDNRSENSSKQQSASERKLLDQLPRGIRLNNRLESLGLTVEELDDRGLLNGGGSVPSYYTSLKQKNRRILELQPRSHRLMERGKETLSKLLNAVFHMLRILTKRGLNLEEYFRSMDVDRKGLIHKKQLLFLLKQLGLPFSPKEMQEITQNYCEPGSDKVDYISFLREGRISKKNNPTQSSSIGEDITESKNASSSGKNHDLSSYTAVLHEVKRLLLEAIKALNKNFDDVYRMFTRWDTQGTGTVTATQFLRVLARLHIELSDQDQDFLVELLDTNAMGRIDFESLLSFCFNFEDIASPQGIIVGTAIGFDDNAGETLSAVSIDQNSLEQKSTTSGNLLKRPHTASISRPYNNNLNQPSISNMSASKQMDNAMIPMNGLGNNASNFSYQKSTGNDNAANAFEERKKNDKVRPSTAVGRVSSSNNRNQFQPPPRKQPEEIEEEDGVLDLPDDVIHGEEIYLSNNNNSNNNYRSNAPQVKYNQFFQEGGNDDYPPEPSPLANSPSVRHQQSNGLPLPSDGVIPGEYYEEPPTDHLVLLANQILTTLRDIILTRYRRGRGLREIFHHFDRDNKGYFNTDDFIQATSDLSIETSEKVAIICIKQIGIDSIQYVTYGEFVTFVLDSDHHLLQNHVQEQIATLLEKQGKEYSYWIVDVFQNEEETLNSNSKNYTNSHYQNGFLISKNAFLSSLKKIGLNLTNSEFQRLIDRFDVYGNDYCSVERFMKMIQYSKAWKHSEVVLQYQEQAIQEANYLREQKKQYFSQNDINNGNEKFMINGTEITDELINMCEYLGICILSEQNMIWIAADALRAPLPVNWSAQKDSSGKTYFYNHLTNQSQWEHPLDPHFRNLRDKYRQSTEDVDIERTSNSNALPSLNASNKLHSNKQTKVSSLFEKPPPKYHNSEVEQQVFNKYNYLHNPSGGLPVPGEVFADSPPAINQQQKKHSSANTRPASALPEKITITFGNPKENPKITDARNSNGFNSDLSSNTSSKNRPVSAPTFLPPRINLPTSPNEDSANNQSNHGSQQRSQAQNNNQPHHHPQQNQQQSKNNTSNHAHHHQQQQQQQNNSKNGKHGTQVFDFLQQNKAIVEAVYSAPYLKAPNTHQNYQDTTHIPNRHYHNPSYHMKKDDALLMSNMLNSSNTTSASNMNQTSSTIASGNYYQQQQTPLHQQQQGSKPENLSNTMSSNTGPSKLSSNQKKSGNTTTTMSAVDRALSIGKNSQQILQERDQLYGMPSSNYLPPANGNNGNNGANNLNPKIRTAKLNEMLDGNILEKLDHVIAHKR